ADINARDRVGQVSGSRPVRTPDHDTQEAVSANRVEADDQTLGLCHSPYPPRHAGSPPQAALRDRRRPCRHAVLGNNCWLCRFMALSWLNLPYAEKAAIAKVSGPWASLAVCRTPGGRGPRSRPPCCGPYGAPDWPDASCVSTTLSEGTMKAVVRNREGGASS